MSDAADPELPILLQALSEPLGLVIAVEDFTKARGRLVYVASKQKGELGEKLQALSFRRSPYNPERELWIVSSRTARITDGWDAPVDVEPGGVASD